jgi:hypothetical protein
VVKATDSKSVGVPPRRFESCRCRTTIFCKRNFNLHTLSFLELNTSSTKSEIDDISSVAILVKETKWYNISIKTVMKYIKTWDGNTLSYF